MRARQFATVNHRRPSWGSAAPVAERHDLDGHIMTPTRRREVRFRSRRSRRIGDVKGTIAASYRIGLNGLAVGQPMPEGRRLEKPAPTASAVLPLRKEGLSCSAALINGKASALLPWPSYSSKICAIWMPTNACFFREASALTGVSSSPTSGLRTPSRESPAQLAPCGLRLREAENSGGRQ